MPEEPGRDSKVGYFYISTSVIKYQARIHFASNSLKSPLNWPEKPCGCVPDPPTPPLLLNPGSAPEYYPNSIIVIPVTFEIYVPVWGKTPRENGLKGPHGRFTPGEGRFSNSVGETPLFE